MTDEREAELCEAIRVLTGRLLDAESRLALWERHPDASVDPTIVTDLLRRGKASARDLPLIARAIGANPDAKEFDVSVLVESGIFDPPGDLRVAALELNGLLVVRQLRPFFSLRRLSFR